MKTLRLRKLQYISQGKTPSEQLQNIQQALAAGCDWIQLRWKNATTEEVEQVAIAVKTLCDSYQATLIINDHPEVAAKVDAHGVHLGLTDMPVTEARKIVGPDKIIGGTANTLEHILQRVQEQCNYVGLGPFRFTTTKEKLSPILGLEGYRSIKTQLQTHSISMPVIAIGGLQEEDIDDLIKVGVYGIAVSGLITQAKDKKETVGRLQQALGEKIQA